MSSPRKLSPLPANNETLRFLYLIINQQGIAGVNWNQIAKEMGMNNNSAARMRWFRFKTQMEGPSGPAGKGVASTSPAKGSAAGRKPKGDMTEVTKKEENDERSSESGGVVKVENDGCMDIEGI